MESYEALCKEAKEIQDYLQITMSDNPQEVVERGNVLMAYLARTASMLADAKLIVNKKRKSEAMQLVKELLADQKLSAKVQNAFIDSLCADEQHLVDWIERLNAACTHQMDWCRSIVSKKKAEILLSNMGREFQ